MPLEKLGAPLYLRAEEVEDGQLLEVISEPYIRAAEKSKWGKRRGIVTVKLPNGEERRWTMNTTTWDRCVDVFGTEPSQWVGKQVKARKTKQVVRGEEKMVLYGIPIAGQTALAPAEKPVEFAMSEAEAKVLLASTYPGDQAMQDQVLAEWREKGHIKGE